MLDDALNWMLAVPEMWMTETPIGTTMSASGTIHAQPSANMRVLKSMSATRPATRGP